MEPDPQAAHDAERPPSQINKPPHRSSDSATVTGRDPMEPAKNDVASSALQSSNKDKIPEGQPSPSNNNSPASGSRNSNIWEIHLQRQSNGIIPLIRIPGITESPQPVEILVQTITHLHNQDIASGSDNHASKLGLFDRLSANLLSMSKSNRNLRLIDQIIVCRSQAVLLTPDNDPLKSRRLVCLGESLGDRGKAQGRLPDFDIAIGCFTKALELPETEDVSRVRLLISLAVAFQLRHDKSNEVHDITKSIEYLEKMLEVTRDEGESDPRPLFRLGKNYHTRFDCSGESKDIDKAIEYQQQAVDCLPDEPKDRIEYLSGLGRSFSCRFDHFGSLNDIDRAIECMDRVNTLIPEGHSDKRDILSRLVSYLKTRFDKVGELADIDRVIEYQTRTLQLAAEGNPDMPGILAELGLSHHSRFKHSGKLVDINQAIEYHTRAVQLTPAGHATSHLWLTNLGNSYRSRFFRQGLVEDIDKAVEYQMKAVAITPEGHVERPRWLNNLGNAYGARFQRLSERADIDREIECKMQAVALMAEGHPEKPRLLTNLGNSYTRRFEVLGEPADIDQAIESQTQAVFLTQEDHIERPTRLQALANSYGTRFISTGNMVDIHNAIEHATQAVQLTPEGHSGLPSRLTVLGECHLRRFEGLGELADIEQAIECHTKAVSLTPEGHANLSDQLNKLGLAHWIRFTRLHSTQNFQRAGQCFERAAQHSSAPPSARFTAAQRWARLISLLSHGSPLLAHSVAMELVTEVVWLGATAGRRYETVSSSSIGALAVEAAAAAISAKEYVLALEWLEEGRSIVWNQHQQLRSPLDELSAIDSTLARNLKQAAQCLEAAGVRASNILSIPNDEKALEDVSQHHRRLAGEYEDLLRRARSLPGLHNFLKPKKATDFIHVARKGPVVVINVHTTRCDALILLPGSTDITHIPLSDLSHDEVAELRGQIENSLLSNGVRERGIRINRERHKDSFERVLSVLWHKIAKPVLDSLGYKEHQPIDKLPHVTWCTTGDLSFLPIHAAGCYDQSQASVFDLCISSYTPTLGALLPSTSYAPTVLTGILAVGQEATAGCAPLPGTIAEIASIRQHAREIPHLELQGGQATIRATLDAMEQFNSVHLACHASQNVADPTQSGFHLHDGALSLAAIAGKSFKNKGLAFLSACQTAAGDKKLPDEAVHLAAGMLVAGYPSVIATMWSIQDEDAPLIADRVYAQLIQSGKIDSTGAAKALHVAVGALRAQVGDKAFARWVPYVHMGV